MQNIKTDTLTVKTGYAPVNGLNMYYEIHGEGKPLVLIHGGGSTLETSFGRVLPLLAKNHQVIAVEMQAHGRTSDRDADLSFEQDADDVAALLQHLHINQADFLGFSNGGTTTLQIAIRHPQLTRKIILGSALSKRNGVPEAFWDFMEHAKLETMPPALKDAYLQVAPDPEGLQVMHDRDAKRMVDFKDIPDSLVQSIEVPALIIIGDKDVITPEHALEMHRLLPQSRLAVLPGGHGAYLGEATTLTIKDPDALCAIPLMERFLDN